MTDDRFEADAAARGLDVSVVTRPEAGSLREAASLLGIDAGDIVKTLVVKRHDGDFILALVPGGRSIAWKKLRAVVGVNKLSMPDASVALEATGYERGTITPIGTTAPLPVYADERILGRRIALGAGRHGASAFVDADALVAAYGAVVADITDPE
jgi:Cys-tRNA(Pro) deacylase